MLPSLCRKALPAAFYVERYILSFAYLYLGWREFRHLDLLFLSGLESGGFWSQEFVALVRHMNLLILQVFIGFLLFISHRPVSQPRNLAEIAIPLAASFFSMAYSFVHWLPAPFQGSLLSAAAQAPCAVAGLICGLIGPMIATWGVMHLGRSFGVFVAVRDIVLQGPYRYVRHPIYLGYICMLAGIVLTNFSTGVCIMVTIHVWLLLYRAHLEESRLAETSPAYREYMQSAGFIFPRLRRRVGK